MAHPPSGSVVDPHLAAEIVALRARADELERQLAAAAAVPATVAVPRLLYARQVAALLGFSTKHVYALMKRGVIPTVRILGAVRVPEDELAAWLAQLRQDQRPETRPVTLRPGGRPRSARRPA